MHPFLIALLWAAAAQAPSTTPDPGQMALLQSTPLAEYIYPGATAEATTDGTEFRRTALTTPDVPPRVLEFYESKFGEKLAATCFYGRPDGWVASYNNSRTPDSNRSESGSLTLHMLSRRSGTEHLTVVISRAAGERLTHIIVLLAG